MALGEDPVRVVLHGGRPWLVELCRWSVDAGGHADGVYRVLFDRATGYGFPDDELWFEVRNSASRRSPPGRLAEVGLFLEEGTGEPYLGDLREEFSGACRADRLRWFLDLLGVPGSEYALSWSRKTRNNLISLLQKSSPTATDLLLGGDQLEVFRLLGESHPYLWPSPKFTAWSAESRAPAP